MAIRKLPFMVLPKLHVLRSSFSIVATLVLAAVASGQSAVTSARAKLTWSGIPVGSRSVGYRAFELTDPSRTYAPDTLGNRITRARTVPVRIWYPAARATREVIGLTFADLLYVNGSRPHAPASLSETGLAHRTTSIQEYVAQRYAKSAATALEVSDTVALVADAMRVRTVAVRGAQVAPGRHPLVLFAGGTGHSVDENVALWEHLASYGYIVAVIPTVAVSYGAEDAFLPPTLGGLETTTRDMELLLASLLVRKDVDTLRIAAAGFSFGGASALVLAARNTRVRAVVGYDASFIANRHLPSIRGAALFDPRRVTVPVLEFHRADTTVNVTLLEQATRTERISVEFDGMDHVDFNSYAVLYGPLLAARRNVAARDSLLAVKADAHRGMVVYTRRFLDAALGGKSAAGAESPIARLSADTSMWGRVPLSMMRTRYRSSLAAADTTSTRD